MNTGSSEKKKKLDWKNRFFLNSKKEAPDPYPHLLKAQDQDLH